MITGQGRDILNTLRKVLVQKIQESEKPTQLSKDASTCDVSFDNC